MIEIAINGKGATETWGDMGNLRVELNRGIMFLIGEYYLFHKLSNSDRSTGREMFSIESESLSSSYPGPS